MFAQWADGQLQSPPLVVVVDLDGKNLKEIGPGALPRWSADGKTILYSAIVLEDQGMSRKIVLRPISSRLSVMDADGKNAHPLAGERTFDGVFSPDGKQIAYVHADDKTPAVYVCDADGSHPHKAGDLATCSATPRWCAASIAFRRQPLLPGSIIAGDESGIWLVASDGMGLHRGSPDLDPATIDRDAAVLTYAVTRAAFMRPAVSNDDDPNAKRLPEGLKLVYEGTKVFIRDATGRKTPAPDGAYRVPEGAVIHVRNGEKVYTVPSPGVATTKPSDDSALGKGASNTGPATGSGPASSESIRLLADDACRRRTQIQAEKLGPNATAAEAREFGLRRNAKFAELMKSLVGQVGVADLPFEDFKAFLGGVDNPFPYEIRESSPPAKLQEFRHVFIIHTKDQSPAK